MAETIVKNLSFGEDARGKIFKGITKGNTVLNSATDVLWTDQPNTVIGGDYVLQQNAALTLNANGGTTGAGTGMLYFNITYKIVNTTATMV